MHVHACLLVMTVSCVIRVVWTVVWNWSVMWGSRSSVSSGRTTEQQNLSAHTLWSIKHHCDTCYQIHHQQLLTRMRLVYRISSIRMTKEKTKRHWQSAEFHDERFVLCHLSLFTLWKVTFLLAVTSIRKRKTHLMTLNNAHQIIEPTSHTQSACPAFPNTFVYLEQKAKTCSILGRLKFNSCWMLLSWFWCQCAHKLF